MAPTTTIDLRTYLAVFAQAMRADDLEIENGRLRKALEHIAAKRIKPEWAAARDMQETARAALQ